MKLFLLNRTYDDNGNIYDCYNGFVIRADTEDEARLLASSIAADEGKNTWLDPTSSSCEEIRNEGIEEIILSSFHAG